MLPFVHVVYLLCLEVTCIKFYRFQCGFFINSNLIIIQLEVISFYLKLFNIRDNPLLDDRSV